MHFRVDGGRVQFSRLQNSRYIPEVMSRTFVVHQFLLASCSVPKPFVAVVLHHFDYMAVVLLGIAVSLASSARC